jgi:phosphopantothenoylcysteine decarboxylase/phosphopantothenate--cysteine ligase
MITPFHNKRIVLGVTGSIAVYKAAELASKMAQLGASVDVILTPSAEKFVNPITFQSVTGRSAFVDQDLWGSEGHVQHIGIARQADLIAIAPITANTMAKLAHGIADNLLTVTVLAAECPTVIAPAMDAGMFAHPATQTNLEILRQRDISIIGPVEGHLASGLTGLGRMVEPDELLGHIRHALSRAGPLKDNKVIITAGGTYEPLDPVRGITNRASGKQGFALAQAAIDRGAEVILITGPANLATPVGAKRIDIQSAVEMRDAVLDSLPGSEVVIMAAAVSDFRPRFAAGQKLKKKDGVPEIVFERTPDILSEIAQQRAKQGVPRVLVGFAAETEELISNARKKLDQKGLDLIVANDISAPDAGFAVDTNRVTILDAGGGEQVLPLTSKDEVAQNILERVVGLLDISGSDQN